MNSRVDTTAAKEPRPGPSHRELTEIGALGTTMAVFAHPDDETYLAGGLLAALRDQDQRVVCVTATRGDAGNGLHDGGSVEARSALAGLRTAELAKALGVLGISEHHWLDYADGGCQAVDIEQAVSRLERLMADVGPRTVLSFGLDGFTGHPDHCAVAHWTELAVARCQLRPRLLQAVTTQADLDEGRDVNDRFQIYQLGRPPTVAEPDLAVRLVLDGTGLARKVSALAEQHSQTAELIEAIGVDRFAAWVRTESFRAV